MILLSVPDNEGPYSWLQITVLWSQCQHFHSLPHASWWWLTYRYCFLIETQTFIFFIAWKYLFLWFIYTSNSQFYHIPCPYFTYDI